MFSRKIKLCLILILFVAFQTVTVYASNGVVVFVKNGHYVVSTNNGYSVMEWYGGIDPYQDDQVFGNFDTYGFQNIYDKTMGFEFKVYIEEFGLSKQQAVEWVKRNVH